MKNLAATFVSIAVVSVGFSLPAFAGESTQSATPSQSSETIAQTTVAQTSTEADLVEKVRAVYAQICSKSRQASVHPTMVSTPAVPVPTTQPVMPQMW